MRFVAKFWDMVSKVISLRGKEPGPQEVSHIKRLIGKKWDWLQAEEITETGIFTADPHQIYRLQFKRLDSGDLIKPLRDSERVALLSFFDGSRRALIGSKKVLLQENGAPGSESSLLFAMGSYYRNGQQANLAPANYAIRVEDSPIRGKRIYTIITIRCDLWELYDDARSKQERGAA